MAQAPRGFPVPVRGRTANLEKAIEIKRRAQRCIQSGDLEGALSEYEKLVATEDTDPYNFVLLADLLYKRGEMVEAGQRYLAAASAYEAAGLYKNAIAVCKKMIRLSLMQTTILEHLGRLHALDHLGTEAALYYMQYAEHLVRDDKLKDAVEVLRRAVTASPDEVKALLRLSEVEVLIGNPRAAAEALIDAARVHDRLGQLDQAQKSRARAEQLAPGIGAESNNGTPIEVEEARPAALEEREPIAGIREAPAEAEPAESDSHQLEITGRFVPPALAPPNQGELMEFPGARGLRFDGVDAPSAEMRPPSLEPSPVEEPAVIEEPVEIEAADYEEALASVVSAMAPEATSPDSGADADEETSLARVEELLQRAQDRFRNGDREGASRLLTEAAHAYDSVGRGENAAAIYRSLGRSPQATAPVLELWFANCERRSDAKEGAEVACELGDRALQDGNLDVARGWFERAIGLDPESGLAQRRLARLSEMQMNAAPLAAPEAAPASTAEAGRVEMALGRAEAVTFDLGALLAEFQRGIQAQLSGDAQSHYDLGMTYREMGLTQQAIESFRLAATDPAFASRAAEMIGRSLLDDGSYSEAARELAGALDAGDLPIEAAVNLRFQLGLAYEAAGQFEDALVEFERVFATQPNYPDVALKLSVLRKTLERS